MKKRVSGLLLALALLMSFSPSALAAPAAWDGKTIDVSWYSATAKELYIATPEQLMGLAAIVNGIYNAEITEVIGDRSSIVDNSVSADSDGGGNNKATEIYHFGADDFNGKTVYLTADLDMGGVYSETAGTWSGARFMPIGGQYLMSKNDSDTKLSSSFCGILDGGGHTVYNIFCDRHCENGNYGDGQSVGLIGRLGVHDNDPEETRPTEPAVLNVAVAGYIYSNRSVGGVVGKIGKTSRNNGDGSVGAIIENCANFATVKNTDAKGCGGIAGSGWNGGIIRNCYNAGAVITTYVCPTGGISGSSEITIENCYNTGKISASRDSYAMALGTNNGGAPYDSAVKNSWYLEGSAPGGGYYDGSKARNDSALTAQYMKSADFIKQLGGAYIADENNINAGFPVLAWQKAAIEHTPPKPPVYTDVAESAWYSSAARYVVDRGLFDIENGNFSPGAPMTRGMMVAALTRLGGVASGITDGTNPQGTITREQLATMIYRYAGTPEIKGDLSKFTDVGDAHSWGLEGIKWAVGEGILSGSNGKLNPLGTATRAEAAQILRNYLG